MKVAFLGSKSFGLSILKAVKADLVIHPDDQTDPRSCLKDFLAYTDVHVARNQADADVLLDLHRPDIVLVCGWYWLIKNLSIPHYGIHNSLLPKYRGGAPLVWSIINGEPFVGSTVFQLTPGMDAGPVLHQVRTPLSDTDGVADVLARIESALVTELPAKWRALLKGAAELTPQDESQATYCGQRIPDDGLIDWNRTAIQVHDFIRAQSAPYPGAFTYCGHDRINIDRASVDPRQWSGTPGQVLERNTAFTVIACGDGAVRVHGINLPMKTRLS